MGSAARLRGVIALFLALAVAGPEPQAVAIEKEYARLRELRDVFRDSFIQL